MVRFCGTLPLPLPLRIDLVLLTAASDHVVFSLPIWATYAGHLAAMASLQRHKTVLRWAQECGSVMVLRLLWLRVVIVSDPVLVSQVLSRKANANKPAILSLTNPVRLTQQWLM